ncbi:hypothetical protein TSUD_242980 [Trifolium subterraneum]|uniref:Uncharacterized protein n=1 Tax=Trifolium subterraneum TaxID=3900 RepID=A0A2Z6PDI8_TRISU|nr:hypothetical protein TSUD_242980 [Trifolium subterraneum]
MYVTRPLSFYKKSEEALSLPPPEGPNSGILVIQDNDLEPTSCFGLGQYHEVKGLPFPQNMNLELFYRSGISLNRTTRYHNVAFIPVLNQPLSSNKYYVIHLHGKKRGAVRSEYKLVLYSDPRVLQPVVTVKIVSTDNQCSNHLITSDVRLTTWFGLLVLAWDLRVYSSLREAYINSREEDVETFCFYNSVSEVPLHPLDISDIHQEFEIYPRRSKVTLRSGFSAKSVAEDGYPPRFLSRRWKVSASTSSNDSCLGEASGADDSLRSNKPEFKVSIANKCSGSVVVGKWYSPFMFIKEGTHRTLKEEMRKSMFYEMTLEQKWEQIFTCENDGKKGNTVNVDAVVQKEVVVIAGWEAMVDDNIMDVAENFLWFNSFNNVGEKNSVGLSTAIVERMKWEQEKVGWIGGKEKEFRVKKVEEFEGSVNGWKKFGCYVLVETFVIKRLDGSIVLTYAFKHSHQLRTKWE